MNIVIVESPFSGETLKETQENIEYARMCMKDCLSRGESPYASHLLYTCLLYTSPSPRDQRGSRMPSSA